MAMEIDLQNPGKLTASAKNAKDYTFYLVLPRPHYTPQMFQMNPNCVATPDMVMKIGTAADADGEGSVDLGPKANELKDKCKAPVTDARAVVIATSKGSNKDPNKRLAVVEPVTIKNPVSIQVKGLVTSVNPNQWVAYHHPIFFAEVTVRGPITEVMVEITPKTQPIAMFACWQQDAPGSVGCKQLVLGSCGDPHGANPNCKNPPNFHRGGWWSGVPGWDRGSVKVPITKGVEKYVFGVYPRQSGNVVMTVKGTGPYASLGGAVTFVLNGPHPHPGD
jgi:hypothetical protein